MSENSILTNRLSALLETNQKLKVAYIMPEFPIKAATLPVLEALQKSGVNVVELGIPFSDPLADGSVIQKAAQISIENGLTLKGLLALVKTARESQIDLPIILMGYYNPIFSYGVEKFIEDAAQYGVDGFIIPDLPPEEAESFRNCVIENGLSLTFLISPVTSESRIREIDALSTHFSYCVSVNATTGTSKLSGGIQTDSIKDYLHRVRKNTSKKFIVGFGIKTPQQVQSISGISDGVVVGSALIKAMEQAENPKEAAASVEAFSKSLFC